MADQEQRRKIVVVGGGITGLTTAYYLQKQIREQCLPIDVLLIEASLRLGGKIQTYRKNNVIMERGPESFFDREGHIHQLAKELKIDSQLTANKLGPTYVAVGSQLYPIPERLMAGDAPHVSSFITSGLFSISGKIRASGDFVISRTKEKIDQPVGPFFRRRFGAEIVENLVEPLLASVYAGDVEQLSLQSTFPQLYHLEQQHRSLLLGMRKEQSSIFYGSPSKNEDEGIFETFTNGLETLVEAMEHALLPQTVMKGIKVERIETTTTKTAVVLSHTAPVMADQVVVATPFYVTEQLLAAYHIKPLQQMTAATMATVNMIFHKDQALDWNALAFFVSRNSDFAITSCTWSNLKWPLTANKEQVLLRIYIGRVGDETIVELSDKEIEETVLQDLKKTTDITGRPQQTVITRWKKGMPQYTVGHQQRVAEIKQILQKECPNIHVAGSSFEGISIPECIAQGKQVAQQLLMKE